MPDNPDLSPLDDRGVVLRGGTVYGMASLDPHVADVRIARGIISDAPEQAGDRIVDVGGLIVSPGLVDLHTHVFAGQDLGIRPDDLAFRTGTTTLIDAGSAGAHLIGAFRAATIERFDVRIRAFLNVATIGTTSIRLGGELKAPWYLDEDAAVDAIEANRDIVVGVKVRASADVGGDNAPAALAAARRIADRVRLPLMVHLGPAPASVDEIADTLAPGDIITHAFTGWPENCIVLPNGELRASVRAARERGVLLDIGHGMSGFSIGVGRRLIAAGELPDTISTDVHAYSRSLVVDLPNVLSVFLALGMSLPDVLARATAAPCRAVGLDGGSLTLGGVADIAVFDREPVGRVFADGFGDTLRGAEVLRPVMTFAAGRLVFGGGGS